MQSAKINIRNIVATYIKLCPDEYASFQESMKEARASLHDQKYGQAKNTDSGMRALFEIPVTLHDMLVHNLTEDQMVWFKKGGADGHEGAHWFAKTFPNFTLPTHV